MIKKIIIKNFQSHERTILQLHEGVNVIVGNTDSGKTSILRAINWIVNNKPRGNSFISNWKEWTKVIIKFDNVSIIRHKSKTQNYYKINNKIKLSAIGNGVPKEISDLIKITNVNQQSQLEAPFLLSWTPGAVGRELSRLTGIDDIELLITNLNKQRNETRTKIKNYTETIKEDREELTGLQWVKNVERLHKQAKSTYEELQAKQEELIDITETIKEIEEIEYKIKKLSKVKQIKTKVENCYVNIENITNKIRHKKELLRTIKETLYKLECNRNNINNKSLELKELRKELNEIKICPLCNQEIR